jgi:hypothetical protein
MSIAKLVQNATKKKKGETDIIVTSFVSDDDIKAIKIICKNNEMAVKEVARYLLLDLGNRSAVVRLRSLCIIDLLFLRSKLFRKEISCNIRAIAQCGGFLGCKITENIEHRDLLQHRVKELLEMWDVYYGEFLPEIRAITRYMRESLRLDMPNIQVLYCI